LPLFLIALAAGGGGYYVGCTAYLLINDSISSTLIPTLMLRGSSTTQYYLYGNPQADKAKLERDAKAAEGRVKRTGSDAKAQANATAARTQARVSELAEEGRNAAKQYAVSVAIVLSSLYAPESLTRAALTCSRFVQTDAERKAADIRDRAASKTADYYHAAADQTQILRNQTSADAKASWWSWLGWGSSEKNKAEQEVKDTLQDTKQATKKELEAVKKA
jgi:hypothetical protein